MDKHVEPKKKEVTFDQ